MLGKPVIRGMRIPVEILLRKLAEGARSAGVVLLRYRATVRDSVIVGLLSLVRRKGDLLRGCFAVVRPGHIRISRLPKP